MARIENPIIAPRFKSPKPGEAKTLFGESIVSGVIGIFLTIGVLIFFFQFLLGGISWITSGGDENKVKEARDKIQNALIGLVIVFSIFAIIKLIGYVFGITELENLGIPLVPLI